MIKLSPAEGTKTASNYLRGPIADDLTTEAPEFSKGSIGLIKFHGIYQQDDRDVRKAGKAFSCMVRVSVPGGQVTADQYLALDALADPCGDGSLRITSRQGVQYHYVGKRNLKHLISSLNRAGLNTWAACGDVVRNVISAAEPVGGRPDITSYVKLLGSKLKPRTEAYAEIWMDGEKACSFEADAAAAGGDAVEPLYGATYLPRKFKIGFAYPGENTTDLYSNDLGFVPHFERGELKGFTLLAGGGMGQSNGVKLSHPRMASEIAFIDEPDLLDAAKAVVGIHRDFGNRENRKIARLKYVLDDRGVDWFRAELNLRMGKVLAVPPALTWTRYSDYLGWHEQSAGKMFFGLRVINGRIKGPVRAAIREIVTTLRTPVRFTVQQNLLFTDVALADQAKLEQILRAHGVPLPGELPPVLRHSMACPALPTCGQALTESERMAPDLIGKIEAELAAAGLGGEVVHLRSTGCPNGCARPYTAEIGIVGQSINLYSIYLGGSPLATRLNRLYSHNIKHEEIAAQLRPLFDEWARERQPAEAFGDFWFRKHGAEHLEAGQHA